MLSISVPENINLKTVSFFPNPTTNILTIETSQKSSVEILNLEGQIIKSYKSTDNNTIIDVSSFSSGIYFIKASSDKGVVVKKFIKE